MQSSSAVDQVTSQMEDTYRQDDSDAENDDADQVGKDIDDFEARLRGDKAAPRPGPVKAPKAAAARAPLPVLKKAVPVALGPFSKPATEEEDEAREARESVSDLARFDQEPESP